MTSIKRPPSDPNVFDRTRQNLENTADGLRENAKTFLNDAKDCLNDAGDGVNAAGAAAGLAATKALNATADVVVGVKDTMVAAGHTTAAGGYGVLGAAGWAVESVASTGRFAAKNVARGFAALANAFTGVLKDGKTVTVRELAGDPNAVRFSQKMFGNASDQLSKAGDSMNAAWRSYGEAIDNMAGAGGQTLAAAKHTAGVAGNLLAAVGAVEFAGAAKLAELGTRVAAGGVQMAENGVEAARDTAVLSARISAAVGNTLAVAGQGEITVDQRKELEMQIASFEKEFAQLQQTAQQQQSLMQAQQQ